MNGSNLNRNNYRSSICRAIVLSMIIIILLGSSSFNLWNFNVKADSNRIQWFDYNEGMDQAKTENISVVLYFHADWCGWCDRMEADTFSNPKVVSESKNFVNIKIDGDEQTNLVNKYQIDGYPTVIFLNASGKELNRVVGYQSTSDFLVSMNSQGNADDGFICPLTSSPVNLILILILPIAIIIIIYFLDKRKTSNPPNRKNQDQK